MPPVESEHEPSRVHRPVVFAAVIGGGIALLACVVGLVLIGLHSDVHQDAITALSTIGGTLAGAFAGWMARSTIDRRRDDAQP